MLATMAYPKNEVHDIEEPGQLEQAVSTCSGGLVRLKSPFRLPDIRSQSGKLPGSFVL